ncbi:sigma-70 family RNA polymerase sigma factor [soil metagenome]
MELSHTDLELVAAIASGDRRALSVLYERHRRALWSFIRRFVADEHLAEEVLADTLVAAWRGAGSFRGDARVTTWLFGIARNQAYNHLRRRRPVPVDEVRTGTLIDHGAQPDRVVAARDELSRVAAEIEALSPEHREALLLAIAGDLSYGEISEVLGVPVGTVKSRVANARRRLGERTGEHDDDHDGEEVRR